MYAPVAISEGGRRRRVSKLAANMKQIANQGASGDLRAAKVAVDMAMKVASRAVVTPAPPALAEADEAIVARFLERVRLCQQQEEVPDAPPAEL